MRTEKEVNIILQDILKFGFENEIVEFKEAKSGFDFDKIGRYFSSLCNEANLKDKKCSWLIFGIRDKDKKIVGTNYRLNREDLEKLKSEIANHTTGRISFIEIYEVHTNEGRVVMFEIPASPKGILVYWKGHYYGRDGEEINALNLEEVERIREQVRGVDWSSGIIDNATIDDLSKDAIIKAKELYSRKNPHLKNEIEDWNDITFLNKVKLFIKGKATRTAILLLGKPESEYLLHPSIAKITWILRDNNNVEMDYHHFSCPFLLSSEMVFKKIRNNRYRYISHETLFPDEVDQYDPYIIREALNNCIAHQDYTISERINIVEHDNRVLVFANAGKFIPKSIEEVVITDAPETKYRNPFLVEAMINLNMIDAIGSGIKRMFNIQRLKFFPLPEYELSHNKVKLTITGKVVDIKYARKLAEMPTLSFLEVLSLDKVSKGKSISDSEIKVLKSNKLIEGRKPNFFISSNVALTTGEKVAYIKQRGIEDNYIQKLIFDYLSNFEVGRREDFEKLLIEKMPDVLSVQQKKNKIKNILQKMKFEQKLQVDSNRQWRIRRELDEN